MYASISMLFTIRRMYFLLKLLYIAYFQYIFSSKQPDTVTE